MNGLVIGALVALGMAQQTDTVIPAQGARVLEVDAVAGSVTVTGWDRNEIGVRAEHSSRTYVDVQRSSDGTRIRLEAEARRGPATIVDFTISLPRGMAVEVDAEAADVTVEDVDGGVEADVTQGDLIVRRGKGPVKLYTATGKILAEGVAGGVEAETAADEIRLIGVSGNIVAESAGGDIVIEGATSTSVDVGTVGGRVHYDGTYQRGGSYFFGTHGGTLTLVVPEGAAITFHLASVHGTVINALGSQPERFEGGQRHNLEIGGGGALVEAESFGGRISLVRKGAPGASTPEVRPFRRPGA